MAGLVRRTAVAIDQNFRKHYGHPQFYLLHMCTVPSNWMTSVKLGRAESNEVIVIVGPENYGKVRWSGST